MSTTSNLVCRMQRLIWIIQNFEHKTHHVYIASTGKRNNQWWLKTTSKQEQEEEIFFSRDSPYTDTTRYSQTLKQSTLSPKTATVAVFGDKLSPKSAPVWTGFNRRELSASCFTTRCTMPIVQSAVLRIWDCMSSVRPSVCLSVCLSACNVGVLVDKNLETNCTDN